MYTIDIGDCTVTSDLLSCSQPDQNRKCVELVQSGAEVHIMYELIYG